MSGRRRRGRRRPWDQREGGGQPGQPRVGPNGQPTNQPQQGPNQPQRGPGQPPRGAGGYTGPAYGAPRWQGGAPGGRRRADPQGPRYGRGRRFDGGPQGQQGPPQGGNRRWSPNPGAGPSGGFQNPRWQRGRQPPQRPHEQESRRPDPPSPPPGGEIDPFELFCAYHLGILADDGYRIQNIHEVARRFGTNAAALRQTLAAFGMDADDIVHSGFDLASAQIDIMVAPSGISRKELARPLYDEFRNAPRKARDWAREMAEADRQIEQTIGHDGRWSPPPRDRAGKQS